ncbi:MAG: quinone-dependent dihydroorotate dehydrogenase [Chloroflexi bacterium]|nr:quinone-dependent dihydroorotate dehydrogenase [Chloroflexota bacterium]
MYAELIRPLLFRLDPEQAHHLTLQALRMPLAAPVLRFFFGTQNSQPVEAFGLRFTNRVGLAAGYDKNGVALAGLEALGFGHIECGTVTRIPQQGNPRPRVHRFPNQHAVINSMGFPNDGVDVLLAHLERTHLTRTRLGINIGKGKDTPIERAAEDYCALYEHTHARADYIVINISSPNTANLRSLQSRTALVELLSAVAETRRSTAHRPILVKIAPDLNTDELDDVLDAIAQTGMDGIIATNTTLHRDGLPASATELRGGASGAILTARSTEIIRHIARTTSGRLPIIGVGGIMSADDAQAKFDAGATLVQLYTGMIYAGPRLVRQVAADSRQ